MEWHKEALQQLDRKERIKLINAITGVKPANLIGTTNKDGQENLAIFSSVVHLGSDPALLGFVMRPTGEVPRHTYENILETGYYTINHVHSEMVVRAHYTSAKFLGNESEFDRCGFQPEYRSDFPAPFVSSSRVKIGMAFLNEYLLPNQTCFMVGEIRLLSVPDGAFDEHGELDLQELDSLGIGGLNNYYRLQHQAWFPYARKSELPWN